MEERLYLFEVLIDRIYFEENVGEIPQKKQIVVSVKLGNIVTLEIRSETLPIGGEGGNKRLIDFKSGKSHLMPLLQDQLLQALNMHNLEVTVMDRKDVKPIGTSSAPWDDCFKEMVQESNEEFVSPAFIFDNFCLMDGGVIKGNVQMFLRLSCFGKSIQTQFEVMQETGNRQFLFKMPDMATTFVCSKYGAGSSTDFLPIAPLYNTGYIKNTDKTTPNVKSSSWTAVMEGMSIPMLDQQNSLQSECLFPEYLNIVPPVKDSAITFDIVSLKARPEEDKFFDFLTGKKFGDLEGSIHSFSLAGSMKKKSTFFDCIALNERNYKIPEEIDGTFTKRTQIRLRGGGPTGEAYVERFRMRAGAPAKSPIAECQELMQQFDKILDEYKKAIPPCGQIACSFVPNVTEELCKKSCGVKPERPITSGCGLPQCEYAKYKSALMAMDVDIEKQFIGPAILGNCGHPKCSYQADLILPPIHWDCPEPLPKGECKNPNCPHPPSFNQRRMSSTKGPCGSDQCPYAPPSPCTSPLCPFLNPPPCASLKNPILNKKKSSKTQDKTRSGCPFENPPQIVNMMLCNNPNCEKVKAASALDCGKRNKICESPNCPYRESSLSGNLKQNESKLKEGKTVSCSNPNCPVAVQSVAQACSNSKCPFINSSSSNEYASNVSACSNPECPFRVESKEDKAPTKEACANPDCPFNKASVESCKNPECPFLNKELSWDSKESCDNPECPYKKDSKTESECACDNPTCPSKRETCANPNCPFNLRDLDVCTNPDCPHMKDALGRDLGFCASLDPSFNEFCADKTCVYTNKLPEKKIEKKGDNEVVKVGSQEMIEKGEEEKTAGDRPSVYDMAPCSLKTCKLMGGHLTCMVCGMGLDGKKRGPCPKTCPGDPICALASARKSKRYTRRRDPTFKRTCAIKKKHHHQVDSTEYPGYKIGHRACVMPYFYVPKRMGWLWNIHTPCLNLKPRRGWRPGAVTRSVARAILKHKKESLNTHEKKEVKKRRKNDASEDELLCPKPTLEVKKREGIYHITMNPLKDPDKLEMNENPYMDCTPMQFKVAKDNLDDPNCVCTDEGEFYKYDSSSDDELDIQVTTPAGIIHPERPIKKKVVGVKETQYNVKDLPPPPAKNENKKKGKDDKENVEKDKTEKGKNLKDKLEKNKKDKSEKDKLDKDKNVKGKVEKDKNEMKDKVPKGKVEKDKNIKDRSEKERNVKDKNNKEKIEKDKNIKEKGDKNKTTTDRSEREKGKK